MDTVLRLGMKNQQFLSRTRPQLAMLVDQLRLSAHGSSAAHAQTMIFVETATPKWTPSIPTRLVHLIVTTSNVSCRRSTASGNVGKAAGKDGRAAGKDGRAKLLHGWRTERVVSNGQPVSMQRTKLRMPGKTLHQVGSVGGRAMAREAARELGGIGGH